MKESREILDGIQALGLCLYIKKKSLLIIGDLHLGLEQAYVNSGTLVPKVRHAEVLKNILEMQKKTRSKTIVLLGDLKHEFGMPSKATKDEIRSFIEILSKFSKIVILQGNHDSALEFLIKENNNVLLKKHYLHEGILFIHGDKAPEKKVLAQCKTIIMGHEHPAVALRLGQRMEKYKCFLSGKYERKDLIVVPSFNSLIEGNDLLSNKPMSELLHSIDKFTAFIVLDKTYDFGLVKNLKKLI